MTGYLSTHPTWVPPAYQALPQCRRNSSLCNTSVAPLRASLHADTLPHHIRLYDHTLGHHGSLCSFFRTGAYIVLSFRPESFGSRKRRPMDLIGFSYWGAPKRVWSKEEWDWAPHLHCVVSTWCVHRPAPIKRSSPYSPLSVQVLINPFSWYPSGQILRFTISFSLLNSPWWFAAPWDTFLCE